MNDTLDLLVIGAGPAGISAAVEAKSGGLEKILILEKGGSHSQMIRTYYKEGKRVDARYAGQEAICFGMLCLKDGNRESFLSLMDYVIESFKLQINYNTEVWNIRKHESGPFETRTAAGASHFSKAVIVAIGKMGKPNQPDYYREIPHSLRNDKRILFDITSKPLEGLNLMVVGGGDSAAEYCHILSEINTVTLSYRRSEFSKMNPVNLKILAGLIESGKVRALMPSTITAIEDRGGDAHVRFAESHFEPRTFQAVVYALGGMNPTEFLRSANVKTGAKGEPLVSRDHETSVPGLYVVGDLLGKGHGGGSIIAGFNSSAEAVKHLLGATFGKEHHPEFVTLDHLRF